jgi:hypothetical protein
MFDGRIYRAAFVPLLLVLVVAGFSLSGRHGPLRSMLAPDAFDGPRAFANLKALAARFPERRPGSAGDDALATYVAHTLSGLGTSAATLPTNPHSTSPANVGVGFQVSVRRLRAQTIDGARTLTAVVAERPGSTGMPPIVIMAHRDAVARDSTAELSGTAALLELARVFSQSETRRTIVLVSTSGGSGGDAGAVDFAANGTHPADAAIVLGDVAGVGAHRPLLLPFSGGEGVAPEALQLTLDTAISQEVGVNPGTPSGFSQLAHLALPLATGEEAGLNEAGIPAVLVQVSGERGPSPREQVSEGRLLNFGRAVLSAAYALDEGPDIVHPASPRVMLGRKLLPGWAVRLLALALLLPPLFAGVDALARLRRRREPMLLRWVAWVLSGGLPFFVGALFAILLGKLGIVAAPAAQLGASALSANGSALGALLACAVVLGLALLAWPALVRRVGLPPRPSADGAALAVVLVLAVVALLVWIFNPFACLLLVPATHLWLLAVEAKRQRPTRTRGAALVAILAGTLPLLLLVLLYARELSLGPAGLAESAMLALASGQAGLGAALLWSAGLGCLLTILLLSPSPRPEGPTGGPEWDELFTRGPVSYAGPGSLGGTESALRR